ITLMLQGSDEEVVVAIGSRTGDPNGTAFFMEVGEPSIYTCSKVLPDLLEAFDAAAFRDANVLRLGWAEIDAIQFEHGDVSWRLLKMLDDWRIEEPERNPADKERVEELLEGLRNLEALRFLDGTSHEDVGLESEKTAAGALRLEGASSAGSRVLLFGKPLEDGGVPARLVPPKGSGEDSPVLALPAEFVEGLMGGWIGFRNRVLLELKLADVRGLTRTMNGTTESYIRRGDGAAWEAREGTSASPDNAALTHAISRLLTVVAASWESRASTELDALGLGETASTASITIHLRRDGESRERLRTLVLGNEIEGTGALYGRFGKGDDVFVLSSHRDVGGGVVQPVLEALLARWRKAEAEAPPPDDGE
ncbi:MAG: DUF4340 domain-containing protein, partial [Planctomycetota bacterium]